MPFGPIRRRDLVIALRKLGFRGPYAGGKHEHMNKGVLWLTIPNPHRGEISAKLLAMILRQAGISRHEWEHV